MPLINKKVAVKTVKQEHKVKGQRKRKKEEVENSTSDNNSNTKKIKSSHSNTQISSNKFERKKQLKRKRKSNVAPLPATNNFNSNNNLVPIDIAQPHQADLGGELTRTNKKSKQKKCSTEKEQIYSPAFYKSSKNIRNAPKKKAKTSTQQEIVPEEDMMYSDESIGSDEEITKQKKRKKEEEHDYSDDEPTNSNASKVVNSNQNPVQVDFYQKDIVTCESDMKVPFVNREKVSLQLARALLEQKNSPKGMLPILSQHFGSGKTALVRNFRQVLTKNGYSFGDTEENVKTLMQAALVTVDVSKVDMESKQNFFAICLQGIHAALKEYDTSPLNQSGREQLQMSLSVLNEEPMSSQQQKIKASLKECNSIFHFLKQWSENKLFPLLLFFDELSYLEKDAITEFWKRAQQLFGSTDGEGEFIRYPGIFIVFGGKSATLFKLGRGFAMSPTPSIHLVLDMLKVEHIVTLMNETVISQSKNITIKQLLEQKFNLGEHFEFFCKVLHEYSGGIPRLIIKTIYSFVKNWCKKGATEDLSSKENIEVLFSSFKAHQLFDELRHLSEIRPLPTKHPSKTILRNFYYFATTGIPVTPLGDMIDLIYDLNIGLETMLVNHEQYFRLIVPKFISLSETRAIPENIKVLQQIFSHGFSMSQIVDKGALLEVLVRDTLISKIVLLIKDNKLNGGRWETLHPCFAKSTFLTNRIVNMDTQYVRYMPKIVTNSTVKTREISEYLAMDVPWDHVAPDRDWKKVKEAFFIGNCIIHPAPKSKSSDFYINLPPDCAAAFAVKNYPKTPFTIQMLQQEIDKCFLSTQGKAFSKIALFFFCNGIEHSKLNCYCDSDGYLVLKSGVYELEENSLNIIKTKPSFKPDFKKLRNTPNSISEYLPPHHANKIYIPDNLEVIILGKQSFDSFFNANNRSLLDHLSTNLPNAHYLEYI